MSKITATVLLVCALWHPAGIVQACDFSPGQFCPPGETTQFYLSLLSSSIVHISFENEGHFLVGTKDLGTLPAGMHIQDWDGITSQGDTLRTGEFFVTCHFIDPYDPDIHTTSTSSNPILLTYCGDDLHGPYREQVSGFDISMAFGVGLTTTQGAQLEILDATGSQLLRTLPFNAYADTPLLVNWDLTDSAGDPLPAGSYTCRLDADGYYEEIVFDLVIPAPIWPSIGVTDTHGVEHLGTTDIAGAPVIETPVLEGWLDFGRPLGDAERNYLNVALKVQGPWNYIFMDSTAFNGDYSRVMFYDPTPAYPWPDMLSGIFGAASFTLPPSWADPPELHFWFGHQFHGITWVDDQCDSLGIVDSNDWTCDLNWHPDREEIPTAFALRLACPNPVHPDDATTLLVASPTGDQGVELLILDTEGRVVRTLVDGPLPMGVNEVAWDLRDDQGAILPEGMYRAMLLVGEWGQSMSICGGDVWISSDADPNGAPGWPTPRELSLICYPNPSLGGQAVQVTFTPPGEMELEMAIYDLSGRRIRTLTGRREFSASWQALTWDGRDDAGHNLAAGVYFVRLSGEGRTWSRRLVRLR